MLSIQMSKVKKRYTNNLIAYCSFRLIVVTGKIYFVYQIGQNKKFQFGFEFMHPNEGFFIIITLRRNFAYY